MGVNCLLGIGCQLIQRWPCCLTAAGSSNRATLFPCQRFVTEGKVAKTAEECKALLRRPWALSYKRQDVRPEYSFIRALIVLGEVAADLVLRP